jgi:hypothetical protein
MESEEIPYNSMERKEIPYFSMYSEEIPYVSHRYLWIGPYVQVGLFIH